MALDSYDGLIEAIAAYLNKGATLDTQIPNFIRLTESKLNKILDDPKMDVSTTISLTSGSGDLPADFGSMRSIGDSTFGRIEQVTASQFSDFRSVAGDPRSFAIIGSQIKTAPSGSGSLNIVYTRRILPLGPDAQTNWLLFLAPEIYLYGALLEAEFFGWNDERLPTIKAFYEEALQGLRADAVRRRYGSAPLAPRLGRS